jgi:hypothetical protein
MTQLPNVRTGSAPPLAGTRGAIRWICTNNPFYVLSAGLFLAGLWISFGSQGPNEEIQPEETWALMSWLAGYTLLLAGTAYLLVRFAKVWDDARTVLLLVVLMFLATSVTFDEVLVQAPERGLACNLMGLGFAMAVSEWLLRGIRLVLPAWFRVPYYGILALFFLYPLALIPLVHEPHNEMHMWILFGFASVAGLVFLTLLPASRRGPAYIEGNGSPWRWPLYPWSLFFMLALAVPARAYLLCISMHLPQGDAQGQLVIGPYFLVPFGFALAVLLLEIGLESRRRGVLLTALTLPVALVVLGTVGHRSETVYEEFLNMFSARLGGTPLFLSWCAAAAFYGYAALRGVPWASGALTAALAGLAVLSPASLTWDGLVAPQPAPLLLAAALQLGLGLWRRAAWNTLAGSLLAALALSLSANGQPVPYRGLIFYHLAVLALLGVGAAFDDALGRLLRGLGAALVFAGCLASQLIGFELPRGLPPWTSAAYPLIMAALLAGYGLLLRHRPSLAVAGLVCACWLAVAGWQGYRFLRQLVLGLDYIAVSLALFALAVLISLGKSGILSRLINRRREEVPIPLE